MSPHPEDPAQNEEKVGHDDSNKSPTSEDKNLEKTEKEKDIEEKGAQQETPANEDIVPLKLPSIIENEEIGLDQAVEQSTTILTPSQELINELYRKQSGLTITSIYNLGGTIESRTGATAAVKTPVKGISEFADRLMYYTLYDTCSAEIRLEKQKNDFLQRLMANYYRKRKMLNVLAKDGKEDEAEKKYFKTLDELEIVSDALAREELKIHMESDSLKSHYVRSTGEVNLLFDKFMNSERELAKEFAHADPIKDNLRKVLIDRGMKRQKMHLTNLRKIRLSYIKGRNMLQEKLDALDALNNLGPNLRLFDYEQLKMDNRTLHDKLEEKELELNKIRNKCQNAMQVLAHQREKIAAVNTDIEKIDRRLNNVNCDYFDSREQLTSLKQEKDSLRSEINKMKDQSGLITKPKLLKDMQITLDEADILTQKCDKFKAEYSSLIKQVSKIRSIINPIKKIDTVEGRKHAIKKMFALKTRDSLFSSF